MIVATWNVNSVRARRDRLNAWLAKHNPHVLCLQELKVADEVFLTEQLVPTGYHAVTHGQKTYNGVAILSKTRPQNVSRGMNDDPQARLITAEIDGLRIINVYVPNGAEVGSDKWAYKLDWLDRLKAYLVENADPSQPLLLCGDFNIAPTDRDVANPDAWANSVLCHDDVRAALDEILCWGLVDLFAARHPEGGIYSWWDYRQLAFPRNDGLRLDLILATPPLADKCSAVTIDRDERKGQKPSDHVPVIATFDL